MQTITKSSPSAQGNSGMAAQADAFFDNYRFRDGEILPRLRIHYSTLGSPRRNAQGQIENAVLVIHWTGADGKDVSKQKLHGGVVRSWPATRCDSLLRDSPRQCATWKIK